MSANEYVIKPELPEPFPNVPRLWTCPITGLQVPKDIDENLKWRANILQAAETDRDLQVELYTACARSILFWVNAFAFTFKIQEVDDKGKRGQAVNQHVPYVTWEIQDRHILLIEDAINNGYSVLTDKTREMGASWDHIVVFHHQWLFRSDCLFLEMSRVETDVDGADNPRCLFVKHDYLNRWLPEWMIPEGVLPGGKHRTRMHIVNPQNGSRIDGESSNKAAGSGDRRRAVLLDEFAKMENATKIKSAIRDVSPCLLPNSTPWGPGTAYSKWRNSGKIEVFSMPWYEHPEKGRNRYVAQEEVSSKWKIRSPWYDHEESIRDKKEMAQEIDMDHIGSGDTFFDAAILSEHKRMFGRKPLHQRAIDFRKGVSTDAIPAMVLRRRQESIWATPKGPWKLWVNLINGRPDQSKNYAFGIDVSKGQGASNSVVAVWCIETKEKIAEYADANTPPYDLARIVCAAAIWFGGSKKGGHPILIWEANGPGWDFGRQIVKVYDYPHYYKDKVSGTKEEKAGKRYGWHSSREKKEVVLGMYRRALAHGGYINHSEDSMDEAANYVYYENGGLGPAALSEESPEARKTHGDRVVGDMLVMLADAPKHRPEQPTPPARSMGHRKQKLMQDRKRAKKIRSFDFKHAA